MTAASDTSGYNVGGGSKDGIKFKVHLNPEDRGQSSAFRELRGIEEGLKSMLHDLKNNHVKWPTDNFAASRIVPFGSMRAYLQEIAIRISIICHNSNIELEVVWSPRTAEEIMIAD